VEHTYAYDALERNDLTTKGGTNGLIAVTTFDAEGRVLGTVRSAGDLHVASSNQYDVAGRQIRTVDEAGLVTQYTNDAANRIETAILPGGVTRVTEKYRDGRTRSVTGTAQPAQYYEYGVNPDGTQWTKVRTGGTNSPVWTMNTVDMLATRSGKRSRGSRRGSDERLLLQQSWPTGAVDESKVGRHALRI